MKVFAGSHLVAAREYAEFAIRQLIVYKSKAKAEGEEHFSEVNIFLLAAHRFLNETAEKAARP